MSENENEVCEIKFTFKHLHTNVIFGDASLWQNLFRVCILTHSYEISQINEPLSDNCINLPRNQDSHNNSESPDLSSKMYR